MENNLTNVVAAFLSKDENQMDGTTTYWFELNGFSFNLDRQFTKQVYGLVKLDGYVSPVEHDGSPVTNAFLAAEVMSVSAIAEAIRKM